MAVSREKLERIEKLGLSAHKQIVDAYIAVGYDLDKIAIAKGFYQPDAADVLHGYGFSLGEEWGDAEDDRRRYPHLPQDLVNEYVEGYFPGLDEAYPEGREITLERYLEAYHPGWRNLRHENKSVLSRRLTAEEEQMLNGENPEEKRSVLKRKGKRWKSLY